MSSENKAAPWLWPSYHRPLELARELVRAGGEKRTEGIARLTELRRLYGHVQAVGQELVFALMQDGQHAEALRRLEELERQFGEIDEETLSRRGREKKEAAAAVAANDLVQAETFYRLALAYYVRAYSLRCGHYPGINMATVLLLLAAVTHARNKADESATFRQRTEDAARELLAGRERWPATLSDDNIWHQATAAEAYLLLRQWSQAAEAYRQAFAARNAQPFHRETAGKQARRILDAWQRLGEGPPAPGFPLDELFGPPPAGQPTAAAAQ